MITLNSILFKKLRRDLWQRKGTLVALTVILSIAICFYVSMAAVYQDLNQSKTQYYSKYNLADFTISLKRAPVAFVNTLTNIPNVKRLQTQVSEQVMVNLPKTTRHKSSISIPGIALSVPVNKPSSINNIRLETGSWFSSIDAPEAIVIAQFATSRKIVPGDKIKVRLPDKQHDVLVVGTAYSPKYVFLTPPGIMLAPDVSGYAVLFMPKMFLQKAGGLKNSFNQLIGLAKNKSQTSISNTMSLLGSKLGSYGVEDKIAQQDQTSVKMINDELENVKISTTIFPLIFLIVAALVANVLITRLVTQQRTVIGTFKALGMSNKTLVFHYLSYGLLIGLLGGIIGCIFGIGLEAQFIDLYKLYFQIPNMSVNAYPDVYLIGCTISLATALIGSFTGAIKVMRLAPAESMRPPTPKSGKTLLLERYKNIWEKISVNNRLILRSISRNPFRSFVTMISCLAATALVYSTLSLVDSLNILSDYQFNTLQHAELAVTLRDPLGPDVLSTFKQLPQVKMMETQLIVPAQLSSGQYHKRIGIVGLPSDNKLFTPTNNHGKTLHITAPGLMLNQSLANALHVQTGDHIVMKNLLGRRQNTKVFVSGIVKSYLGLMAYANQSWLSTIVGGSWLTNTVLFKLYNLNKMKTLIYELNRFGGLVNAVEKSRMRGLLDESLDTFMLTFVVMMLFFSAALAISVILNNSLISLNEREREVATFSVIGMTRKEIFLLFLTEGALLNAVGLIFGLILGIGFTKFLLTMYSTELYHFPLALQINRFYQTSLLILVFFVISYAIIYRYISKIKWLDVLNIRE